jgi:ABC-2 type transport system permease protein
MIVWSRVTTLVWKEWLDLARVRGAILPGLMMVAVLVLPFAIAIGVPALTGEDLTRDSDIERSLDAAVRFWPELRDLTPQAAVQAFFFQQFLLLVILVPVTGSMALASHSIIGEKQSRALEPLLATPVTTAELLLSKVLAAAAPALALEAVAFALYLAGIRLLADPGVFAALVSVRTFLVVLGLGPLATLIALQLAVITSSRAGDPRTAQQIGTIEILPIVGILIAQGIGFFWLTVPVILVAAAALLAAWIVLLLFGVAVFDRERILTKWK